MDEDEESQADGFVVDDGYLSDGEGGPIDNDDFGAEVEGTQPSTSHLCFPQTCRLHWRALCITSRRSEPVAYTVAAHDFHKT